MAGGQRADVAGDGDGSVFGRSAAFGGCAVVNARVAVDVGCRQRERKTARGLGPAVGGVKDQFRLHGGARLRVRFDHGFPVASSNRVQDCVHGCVVSSAGHVHHVVWVHHP